MTSQAVFHILYFLSDVFVKEWLIYPYFSTIIQVATFTNEGLI